MDLSSTQAQTLLTGAPDLTTAGYPTGRQCGSRDLRRQSFRRQFAYELDSPWPLPRLWPIERGRTPLNARRESSETEVTVVSQPERTITPTPRPDANPALFTSTFSWSSRHTVPQTRYMKMLLGLDRIPRLHNIIASVVTWILLAGFIISTGAMASLSSLGDGDDSAAKLPFVIIAALFCGLGILGMLWLGLRWRRNYIWLLNKLYLPGSLNGIAGLLATLTVVYGQNRGSWTLAATITATIEAFVALACIGMFVVYNNLLLDKVKEQHREGLDDGGESGENNFIKKLERAATDPSFAPGSIV